MKHKKGVAFYVFLGIVFSIVYLIFAAQPLGKEYQFIPQWKLDVNAQTQKTTVAGEKPLYFKLGQTMGYFTESGTLLSTETFPFKAAISEHYYAPYNTYGSAIDFFTPDGKKAGTITESGFPLFDKDRIFVFLAGGASFVECDSDGKRKWEYNGTVPITAFDSSPSGCVAGFADGTVRQFSSDGTMIQKFSPGGSDFQVILGAALSSDGSMIALVAGQNRQRFVLMKKYDAQTKIVFHEYIAQSDPRQRLVEFSKDGSTVWYNYKDMLGIVAIQFSVVHTPKHILYAVPAIAEIGCTPALEELFEMLLAGIEATARLVTPIMCDGVPYQSHIGLGTCIVLKYFCMAVIPFVKQPVPTLTHGRELQGAVEP